MSLQLRRCCLVLANVGAPEAFMGARIKTAKLSWSSAVVHTAPLQMKEKGQKNLLLREPGSKILWCDHATLVEPGEDKPHERQLVHTGKPAGAAVENCCHLPLCSGSQLATLFLSKSSFSSGKFKDSSSSWAACLLPCTHDPWPGQSLSF